MGFEDNDRMKPSPFYGRRVNVMEELKKFTERVRGRSKGLTEPYPKRQESAEAL